MAAESGTIQGAGKPGTVTGQTDRLGLIVSWVRQAWLDIQNSARWRFLYRDLPGTAVLVQGTDCYDAASFGLRADDFQSWVIADSQIGAALSIWDPTVFPDNPQADQSDVFPTDDALRKRTYGYGAEAVRQGRPLEVAINDRNQLCFSPIPDAAYRVTGTYIRSPQILNADEDVPIMPAQYHEGIKWKALRLLAEFDEADALVLQTTDLNFRRYYDPMRRDLLRRGGPYIDTESLGGSLGGRSFGVGAFGPPPTAGFG